MAIFDKPIAKYRVCIQPTLPLVWDDELSFLGLLGKLQDKQNEIIDTINNIQNLWEEYTDNAIAAYDVTVVARLNALRADLEAQIANLKAYVDQLNEINNLEHEKLWAAINALDEYVKEEFQRIREEMNQLYQDILKIVDDKDADIIRLLYRLFDEFKEEISDMIENGFLVDSPITGQKKTVNHVLDEHWTVFERGGHSITAQQYEDLAMSAEDYAARFISARDYMMRGYQRLIDRNYRVISVFDGAWTTIQKELKRLAEYHQQGPTAIEWAAKDMTADEMAALDLTAYELAFTAW